MNRSILLLFFILSIASTGFCQDPHAAIWRRIDTSFYKKEKIDANYELVQQLKQKAWAEQKYFHVARCYYYDILMRDQRTEDTFYFRNSACIDSLLAVSTDKPTLQLAMHLLQANRLIAFNNKSKRFYDRQYKRTDIPIDYAAFTNEQRDSIAQYHFGKARQLTSVVPSSPTEEILWMAEDPLVFLFKPSLFDIIVAEQIYKTTVRYNAPEATARHAAALALPVEDFIAELESLGHSSKRLASLLQFKEWMDHHRDNPSTYYFIETLARKYLYDKLNSLGVWEQSAQQFYEQYLLHHMASPYSAAKAHIIYQLCRLWYQQSKRYYPENSDRYYGGSEVIKFDTAYRYHSLKASQLSARHRNLLDSFAYLQADLQKMEQSARESALQLRMEYNNLPGEPILTELTYQNADQFYYTIVRKPADILSTYKNEAQLIDALWQFPKMVSQTIRLPVTGDYNKHATYLKLDALPPGFYSILFSHLPLSVDNRKIERIDFQVTSLAVVNTANRFFVLDRKTGMPYRGVKVQGSYDRDFRDSMKITRPVTRTYTTNEQGFVLIRDSKIRNLKLSVGSDTTLARVTVHDEDDDDDGEVYNKEDYDDLVEYYEENAVAEVFTDRAIYRPGQTVHYKVIFMTTNRYTGEKMVMSKANLKGGLFKSIYKKWLKESEPYLFLNDAFGRGIDSVKIRLNEYGSISGSFKIPKSAATGEWDISPDYIETGRNEGSFRVEEYKRPTYEIAMEKPTVQLLPGDSFAVKVKVKSFAGAALNNVRVQYSVTRAWNARYYDTLLARNEMNRKTVQVVDSFAQTNAEGELEIMVKDPSAAAHIGSDDERIDFTYTIHAEVVDHTGESYNENINVTVSSQPVNIRLTLGEEQDRNEKNVIRISTQDKNAGTTEKDISVKIFKLDYSDRLYVERKLNPVDSWLYPVDELQRWFPLINFSREEKEPVKTEVFSKAVNTGSSPNLDIEKGLLPAGYYMLEATCADNGRVIGRTSKYFSVYDKKQSRLPGRTWSWTDLSANSGSPGDTIRYRSGNTESPVYSLYYIKYYKDKRKTGYGYVFDAISHDKTIYDWKWKIPADAMGEALLTHVYVLNNQVFKKTERISIFRPASQEMEIIVERYRRKLAPGGKETFSVSVKTGNVNTAAELVTTLYDASLDKLEKQQWQMPEKERQRWIYDYNDVSLNFISNSTYYSYKNYYSSEKEPRSQFTSYVTPLWWINQVDYSYNEDVLGDWNNILASPTFEASNGYLYNDRTAPMRGNLLLGRVAGFTITGEMHEVGLVTRKLNATSVVRIRGTSSASLQSYAQPLIVLDGQVFMGDLSKLDPSVITDGIILKGADASAIYGARAASGVLVLSTKGSIVFPETSPDPPLPPRKNFNETAFFFPTVYADKGGLFTFSFTMPESVTEWNWKMLAHSKQLQFAYMEKKLNTQLPLMVQPNMPRLLYQGDRIQLQSRITNLDTLNVNGSIFCRIEDAVTGEDITSSLLVKRHNEFEAAKKSTVSSAFDIAIPATQLNPVKIIVSARSQNFSDGEEHIIPVLSPQILVREAVPFRLAQQNDTTLPAITLPPQSALYGISISVKPTPQSALINALPYLANYSFDCAEQTFNKLLAQVTALHIMRTDREAGKAFERAKHEMERDTAVLKELPDEHYEQTPWLSLATANRNRQRLLFELLDTSRTGLQVEKHLGKLKKLQNADGGLSWFEGGGSSSYISNYVLAGFGWLQKENFIIPGYQFATLQSSFIDPLMAWCDNDFQGKRIDDFTGKIALHYALARSYWQESNRLPDTLQQKIRRVVNEQWKNVHQLSLYDKALLILCMRRYFEENSDEHRKAVSALNDIRSLAIDDEKGVRWKEIADNDDMTIAAEETLALIAQAFEEANEKTIPVKIADWLLATKADNFWSSTKATASVIQLMRKQLSSVTAGTQTVVANVNGNDLVVSNDLLSGNDFVFLHQDTQMPVALKKWQEGVAEGHLVRYYFTSATEASKANKDVTIQKELSVYNETTKKWEEVTEQSNLGLGAIVKVTLSIETPRLLRYVYIDDKRAAAFEPTVNYSGYEYGDGFAYYKSIRDVGTQFFAESIPAGRTMIRYEMKVAHEGVFTNGPASLQCMYKPEVTANSSSQVIRTKK